MHHRRARLTAMTRTYTIAGATLFATATIGALLSPLSPTAAAPADDLHWRSVNVESDEQFRGLDAVNADVAWVGGSDGSVFRTTDGGSTWRDVSPKSSEGLLFRDVEARDAGRAVVLAIGEGEASRVFTTVDGGQSWDRTFINHDPRAFYNCMDFWGTGRSGLAVSDPVGGKFRIISTTDFGASWQRVPRAGMPRAVDGEFNFAASGTCLVTVGSTQAWMGSGGGASRIFHTRDRGLTWEVTDSQIPAAPAGGVFSLDFKSLNRGVAVGGDFTKPRNGTDASAVSTDGRQWTGGGDLSGYRSGVAWLLDTNRPILVAAGPTGSDVTYDRGRTWARFSTNNYDAVDCTGDGACWASGPEGAVGVLVR